jgi:ribose/xylose/arabinose/galactoside ABC-type transport system permease subunit
MNTNNKITGILLLLLYVCITTALLNDAFIGPFNLQNLLRYVSLFGIIGVGAVFVIITGGIDLSIGSMVGLTGCILTLTLNGWIDAPAAANVGFVIRFLAGEAIVLGLGWGVGLAIRKRRAGHAGSRGELIAVVVLLAGGAVGWAIASLINGLSLPNWATIPVCLFTALSVAVHLGWLHGILITKLKLQPFVVTLCGLMCYRGLSRWLANDATQGFGTKYDESLRLLAIGKPCTATLILLLGGAALVAWGLWRVLTGLPEVRRTNRAWGGLLLVLGAALVAISSSKYWQGWSTSYGQTLFAIGGWEIKTWSVSVPRESQAHPAEYMKLAVYPLIASVAGLLFALARRAWRAGRSQSLVLSVIVPALTGGGSLAALYRVKQWIGDEAVTFSSSDTQTLTKMLAVCAAMAGLMSGIALLASQAIRGKSLVEKLLLTSAAFCAVLWLLGFTAIHNTKVQVPFFFLLVVAVLAGVFLNRTVYGRYLFALGRNEEAARYSGINTDRMIVTAYVVCAACAGLGGILFTLDSNNIEPSGHGSFYELYAIAAAVLGGCSLRGGEGSVVGVILGAAIMRVLFNAPNMIGVAQQLELFTMGIVILIGVVADEQIRNAATRRLRQAR